jgi:hypothetical protein
MPVPKPTYIYRIIHKENLQILINEGKLVAPNFSTNKNYISIGETELIRQRGNKPITITPYGTMRDYISFYFGVRSPMLYCIWKGFDVQQRPQEDIIYLISTIEKLQMLNAPFIFTDGHSFAAYTQFFNDTKYLNQVDWKTVNLIRWNNTPDDSDRKRRKEAECLVYKEIPLESIIGIVVYNQKVYDYISSVLKKNKINIHINTMPGWYY